MRGARGEVRRPQVRDEVREDVAQVQALRVQERPQLHEFAGAFRVDDVRAVHLPHEVGQAGVVRQEAPEREGRVDVAAPDVVADGHSVAQKVRTRLDIEEQIQGNARRHDVRRRVRVGARKGEVRAVGRRRLREPPRADDPKGVHELALRAVEGLVDDEAVAVLAPLVEELAHVEVVPFVLRDAFAIIGIQPPVVVLVDVPARVVPDALREARHLPGVGVPVPRRQVNRQQVQLEVVALPRVLRQLELLEELVQVQHVLGQVVVNPFRVIRLNPIIVGVRAHGLHRVPFFSVRAPPLRVVLVRRDPQRAEGAGPVRLDAVVRGDGVDVRLAAAPQEGRLQGLVHLQLAGVAAPAADELDLAVRQRARVEADVEGLAAEGAQRHARRGRRGLAPQIALHRDVAQVDGGGRDRELVAVPGLELLERVVDAVHFNDSFLAARVDLDLERGPRVDGALEPLVSI